MRKFDIDIKIKKIGAGNTMYKYVHPQGLLFKIIIDYIYAKVHPLKKKNIFFFLIKLKFASWSSSDIISLDSFKVNKSLTKTDKIKGVCWRVGYTIY